MDRRRLILTGAASLVGGCASSPRDSPLPPPADDRMMFAQAHLELRPALAAQHFDCAVGGRLTARRLPALTAVFERVAADVAARIPREIVAADPGVCIRLLPGEGAPAGTSRRAALVAAYAQSLGRLAPDRRAAVEARAGDVAHAEVLCGLARVDQVRAGWSVGREVFEAALRDPGFVAQMDRAAAEVAEARRDPIESPACAAERRVLTPGAG